MPEQPSHWSPPTTTPPAPLLPTWARLTTAAFLRPLLHLTCCIHCSQSLVPSADETPTSHFPSPSFPLCSRCVRKLCACPPLCPRCASPLCLSQPVTSQPFDPRGLSEAAHPCLRPWIEYPDLASFTALYLMSEHGYPILRQWKKKAGTLFTRQILQPHQHASLNSSSSPGSLQALIQKLPTLNPQVAGIVPLPQDYFRAWQMQGSRAAQLAHWLSGLTQLPVLPLLETTLPPSSQASPLRQAERKGESRRSHAFALRYRAPQPARGLTLALKRTVLGRGITATAITAPQRVILVDDFLTTGTTARRAAQLLRQQGGIAQVDFFCLGIKMPKLEA